VRSSSVFAVVIFSTLVASLCFSLVYHYKSVDSAPEFKEEAINGRIFHYNNGRVVVDKDHNIIEVVIQP
jgi:hypothetical protein